MASVSFKTQNLPTLSILTFVQLLIVYVLSAKTFDISYLDHLAETGGTMLLISVLTAWLSNLVPADIKSNMVFLKIRYALPGHRFIQSAERDHRIDTGTLKSAIENYDELRNSPEKQNAYWYASIFRPNQEATEISGAHKTYLLFRDAATVSVLLTLIYFGLSHSVEIPLFEIAWQFTGVFLLFAIGLLIAANNGGKRLVNNSTAIFLSNLH